MKRTSKDNRHAAVQVMKHTAIFVLLAGFFGLSGIFAQEARKDKYDDPRLNTPVPFTLGDRDRLHTVEINIEALKELIAATNRRIDDMNRRIDDMNHRVDDMNRRIDDTNKGLETTNERMLWMFGILIALGGGVFAYLNSKFDKKFDMIVERLNSIDLKLERAIAKNEEMEKRQDRMEAEIRSLNLAVYDVRQENAAIKEELSTR